MIQIIINQSSHLIDMNTSFRNKLTANSSPKANNGSFAFTNMKEASNKLPNKINNTTTHVNNGSPLSNFLNLSNTNSIPKNNSVSKANSFMDSLPSFPSSPSASASPNKMNTFTSFQPIESIKNIHKNVLNSDAMKSFTSPIKESFHQVVENGASSVISIPIIIALGFFMILFIIAVIFREQLEFALNVSWQKIKSFFEPKNKPTDPVPAPVPVQGPTDKLNLVDYAAINNNMPCKKDGKEVFNIAVDKYAYDDAEPLCKSFGAELATYDQVKEAWKKGADWCNYGWVKGQSAVFPTQKETYDKLQNGPESERMSCGVPGVNGGYFDNPALRFGVNCYGEKPSENDTDIRQKMAGKSSRTPGALAYDKKVQDFTAERNQIPLNSFNSKTW